MKFDNEVVELFSTKSKTKSSIRNTLDKYVHGRKFIIRLRMDYQEALARTLKLQEYAIEFNHKDTIYIVVPADYNEMQLFLADYYSASNKEKKLNCEEYSSDGKFSVYRIDVNFHNKNLSSKSSTAKK